jgi:MFS family permease
VNAISPQVGKRFPRSSLTALLSWIFLNAALLAGTGVHGEPSPVLGAGFAALGLGLSFVSFHTGFREKSKAGLIVTALVLAYFIASILTGWIVTPKEYKPLAFYSLVSFEILFLFVGAAVSYRRARTV